MPSRSPPNAHKEPELSITARQGRPVAGGTRRGQRARFSSREGWADAGAGQEDLGLPASVAGGPG